MKYNARLQLNSSCTSPLVTINPAKPRQHLNGLFYFFFFTTILINTNPFMMELKTNESKKFEDLTVTLTDGGHKILMGEDGRRSGDLSFAEITLQTHALPAKSYRIYHPEGEKEFNKNIEFGNYIVTAKDMEWNGVSVKLAI
ncbi:MAG TPA: hypothetical protein VFI29_04440, partial [Hanamia sp.]|nr:hypothetical protein [Hanamia sp.]